MSIILSFLFPTTKADHSLPPQEACGNKYTQDKIENYVLGKRELPMIRVRLLKRRRRGVKVDPSLVANGR
jgi:hypothetical protein